MAGSGRPKSVKSKNKADVVKKAVNDNKKITCAGCNLIKSKVDFYVSYNPIHHTGRVPYCKKCTKQMISDKGNVILEKVKNTLQLIDKPFIYDIWKTSIDESGDTFGNYIKNIAMHQFRDFSWKDSIFEPQGDSKLNYELSDMASSNEVTYSEKWMGNYTKSELDYLEKYMTGLNNDFKINTENHKDYAKKIAKASLYMDKCFEDMMVGVQGADKRYKDAKEVFDGLSKSAQFAESGRGQNDVSLGCFGKVFEKVEAKSWVFEHIPLDEDGIDKIINQFSNINKSL